MSDSMRARLRWMALAAGLCAIVILPFVWDGSESWIFPDGVSYLDMASGAVRDSPAVLLRNATLLSIAGLYLLYLRHRAGAPANLGIWLVYPPVYYIMLWSSRYRYPINWTLVLTAAVALSHVVSVLEARRRSGQSGAR